MACAPLDFVCKARDGIQDVISTAANDTLQELTNQALESFGAAVASVGTIWVQLPTPVLTAGTGSAGGGTPPGAWGLTTILGYVQYIGLALCVLSVIGIAALFIWRGAIGGGGAAVLTGRLGIVLIAVALISGASALVAFLLPDSAPGGSVSATGFMQNSLWYFVGALAVMSIIIGAIRMAWEQRANPGKELLQSILTLILVSGAGLSIITIAAMVTDAFSIWVLNESTGCDVTEQGESNCFGTNIYAMIALSATSPIGTLAVLIFAVIAFLMTVAQVVLMVIRGGLLVVLAGVLPLTASFTNTQMGRQWFQRAIGWTLAFLLYKPAAALVYSAGFRLVGSDAFGAGGSGLVSIITGMGLMLIALFALPALLRFVMPMTAAVIGGGAGGLAMMGMAGAAGVETATGAISRTSSSSLNSSAGGPSATGQSGSSGPSGSSGSAGSSGKTGSAPSGGGGGGAAGGGTGGGGATGGGAAGGTAGAAGGGTAGAAGGGTAASGAAAGAAGTGVGIPVAVGIMGVQAAGKAVGAAKSGLESAAGDSAGGPSGS
jgi:hypothetical protein